jgi:hypothetical protein
VAEKDERRVEALGNELGGGQRQLPIRIVHRSSTASWARISSAT